MSGHIPDALSPDWCTPNWICEALPEIFGDRPDLDPCSNPHSHVRAKREFTLDKGDDGLVDAWNLNGAEDNIYVNPPFGKGWWRPKPHGEGCNGEYYVAGSPKKFCLCAAAGRREYIWPSDRKAKKAELGKPEFDAWAKQYRLADIGDWIRRCADYGDSGLNVIGLLPSYPDTRAWQRDVWPRARAIFFPKGRLHFRLVYTLPDGEIVEKTGPAPMACALPIWTPDDDLVDAFEDVFEGYGHIVLR